MSIRRPNSGPITIVGAGKQSVNFAYVSDHGRVGDITTVCGKARPRGLRPANANAGVGNVDVFEGQWSMVPDFREAEAGEVGPPAGAGRD